jgi:high affinity Mn2+ porin
MSLDEACIRPGRRPLPGDGRAQEPAASESGNSGGFSDRLWLSGQINIVAQGHSAFPSPYSGPDSFSSLPEVQTSRVLTLYSGFHLNGLTDVLADLESTNGKNLSNGRGLAGFPNLDLAGVPNTHPYLARALLHWIIPLGSELADADRGPLQLESKVPARRLELYLGKMSLLDFFDVNEVGSDSHFQFLNWTVDKNAPYGYPADTRGYTWAALVEYHDRRWIFRFAEAMIPKVTNPDQLEVDLTRSRSENIQWELHHKLR